MVKSSNTNGSPQKLTPEEFVLKAITALRTEKSKGIHVVRSGFNKGFREYFGNDADPIQTTTRMRQEGKIAVFLSKGGASLYLRTDLRDSTLTRHDEDWAKRDQQGRPLKTEAKPDKSSVLQKILDT
ncbi:MAG: hypothetical protein KBE09_03930 [Candidatus Pacebacteria bacterium]|nr:hypothetical protein [Candidatus Paceibacterota bacterium]